MRGDDPLGSRLKTIWIANDPLPVAPDNKVSGARPAPLAVLTPRHNTCTVPLNRNNLSQRVTKAAATRDECSDLLSVPL